MATEKAVMSGYSLYHLSHIEEMRIFCHEEGDAILQVKFKGEASPVKEVVGSMKDYLWVDPRCRMALTPNDTLDEYRQVVDHFNAQFQG